LRIDAPEEKFTAVRTGEQNSEWKNIPDELIVKPGCIVMILANRYTPASEGDREIIYANGDLGHYVRKISAHHAEVQLHRTGQKVIVQAVVREKLKPRGQKGKRADILGTIDYMPLRVAYASTVHKCCKADTLIPVFGRGLTPIGTVTTQDITPYGRIIGAVHTRRETFRVITGRGYTVDCSGDHRWLTLRGLVATKDLTTTDQIELAPMHQISGHGMNTETAWALGALVGDGYYANADGHIEFTNTDPTVLKRMTDFFVASGLTLQKVGAARARVQNKHFRAELKKLGLDYVKSHDKCVPKYVLEAGAPAWCAFLGGLYDTDGSLSAKRACLTTVSLRLATEVQLLLLYLGVPSKRRRFLSGYKGRGSHYWQVTVAPAYFHRFLRAVPFYMPKKAAEVTAFYGRYYNRRLLPFEGFDTIAEVHDLGEVSEMVDIEVEGEPHLCAFGPFLGHNSQGLSLDNVQVMINSQFWLSSGMMYVGLSRARTPQGLRIVGTPEQFMARVRANPLVTQWL
jgi:LAGLIDADG-like domain